MTHDFTPIHWSDAVADYVVAACSCGWTGAYTHAFDKYAQLDHDMHVQREREKVAA